MNKIPINIWINDQRYEKLSQVGLEKLTEEVLAGMKVLKIFCTEEQKDRLIKKFPKAKYDQSTTKSIELLPANFKDELFDKVIEKKSTNILSEVL
jgi:hypothetical protein